MRALSDCQSQRTERPFLSLFGFHFGRFRISVEEDPSLSIFLLTKHIAVPPPDQVQLLHRIQPLYSLGKYSHFPLGKE